jgi:DUF917 family protein
MSPRRSCIQATGFLWLCAFIVASACGAHPERKARTLTESEMDDIMVGASIQASRSSNSASMIKAVKQAVADGKRFTLIAPEDVPDTWTIVLPSGIGGGGAWDYVRDRVKQQNIAAVPDPALKAIQALGTHVGKKFDAVMRVEASGATLSAFQVASSLGVPVVDACISGRAHPEISESTTFINGVPMAPVALVTRWGDTIFIDKAVDDFRVEDLARAFAVASGGSIQAAGRMMSGSTMKRSVIHGSISQALLFGRTVREAKAQGQDPVAALLKVANGFKLFRGEVTKADMKGDRGFTWWDVELKGTHEFEGHTYRVFVKNENIVTWLDGVPDAMSPDFISNLDPNTGDAIAGQGLGGYPIGQDVAMVGIPASPMWRTAKGIEVFGPRHFGFDFDYRPVEEIQRSRRTIGTD